MTADDLARRVAKDLAPELGTDIPAKTEDVIRGEGSRGWGNVTQAVEIGGFIVHTASLAWDIYKEYRDMNKVREFVVADAKPPAGVSKEKADLIVNSVLENLPKS
ncbi:MAG: hypothetical protein ABWZ19_12235 [Hyphomicrobium sp.]